MNSTIDEIRRQGDGWERVADDLTGIENLLADIQVHASEGHPDTVVAVVDKKYLDRLLAMAANWKADEVAVIHSTNGEKWDTVVSGMQSDYGVLARPSGFRKWVAVQAWWD